MTLELPQNGQFFNTEMGLHIDKLMVSYCWRG